MVTDKYRQIVAELSSEIEKGKYDIGDTFPIREKLAERFNVTKATVNRAMNILISKGFLAAKRGSGTVVVSTNKCIDVAYVAENWLMGYVPSLPGCKCTCFSYKELFSSRSELSKLSVFDGVLWSHPDEKYIPQIIKFNSLRPGIIINRAIKETNYVATECEAIFRDAVSERLKKYPLSTPYFLSTVNAIPHVYAQRLKGFLDACRNCNRFYEHLTMPEKFQEKLDMLKSHIDISSSRPLLIFADSQHHTGAVSCLIYSNNLQWGNDVMYMDFENRQPETVYGVVVTSVLQDFKQLSLTALEALLENINNTETQIQKLLIPSINKGNT